MSKINKKKQKRLKPGKLLNNNGTLAEEGYSTKLIKEYNFENIKQGWLRRKEWDYYAILTNDYGIALTVAELGIMALYNIVFLDFKNKKFITDEETKLFSMGKQKMPKSSEIGNISFNGKKIKFNFSKSGEKRKIKCDFPSFNKGEGLYVDLELTQSQDMETMVIATSWKENRSCFYYNQKINCMPAKGRVVYNKKTYLFNEENNAFGVLDWGRGVWTYKNRWYWSSLSTKQEGHIFGWNFGYGFSDRTSATENMVFYDGKAYKFDEVKFKIPKKNKKKQYLEKWKIEDSEGKIKLTFDPIMDRNSKVNLLIFKSVQHQVFGMFNGTIQLEDNKTINIKDQLGFAEDVYNRW